MSADFDLIGRRVRWKAVSDEGVRLRPETRGTVRAVALSSGSNSFQFRLLIEGLDGGLYTVEAGDMEIDKQVEAAQPNR